MVGVGGGDVRARHVEAILADLSSRDAAGAPVLVEAGL
jgi:methanogenic corrinoid protein MtbC1